MTRLRALLDAGRGLVAELDTDAVLTRLLDVAREQTGARYAAIGVLDDRRERLERFITAGIDDAGREAIGEPPRGRGLLGLLIREPHPVRVAHVGEHESSSGFPPNHPPMDSFLGVPILIHGEAWGNLYLTDKPGGEFDEGDEEVATVLADWAAIAIENARLYRDERERRAELERANHRLATTIEVGRGLGGVTDPAQVLDLVADRSRELLNARRVELAVRDGDDFVVAAAAGEGADDLRGLRLPLENSVAAVALRVGQSRHFPELPPGTFAHDELGAREAVVAPMLFRGRSVGVLVVLDHEAPGPFGHEDVQLVEALAAGAAAAIATAQEARDEALRSSIRASEDERRRWARELHDQTLQDMAALRVLLATARNASDAELRETVDNAVELLAGGVGDLRALINDLRPPALDELGVSAALDTLIERTRAVSGLEVDLHVDLAFEDGRAAERHSPEVELAIYRLVQEALTNAVKHAEARRALVQVVEHEDGVEVEVRDDGHGFRPEVRTGGFGLVGMRERLAAVGATLAIRSEPGRGTTLRATIPTT